MDEDWQQRLPHCFVSATASAHVLAFIAVSATLLLLLLLPFLLLLRWLITAVCRPHARN
jgi:hypothetical protein